MKNNLFIVGFLLISVVLIFSACNMNTAAVSTCEALWQYQIPVIMDNNNLTEGEKEAWAINIMQGLDYSDDKIADEIKKLREQYKWHAEEK